MSNQDYTKFSAKKPATEPEKKIEETAVPVENVEVEEISTPEPPEEPMYGEVTDCKKLNVRNAADTEAEVLCTIDAGSEVVIIGSESTDEFYKVFTAAGVEGFCMKQFITLVQ